MSKTILLTRGYSTIVDDDDFKWLSQWKWQALVQKNGAAYASHGFNDNGKVRHLRMHRLILGITSPKVEGDHINGDTLDNRRSNLRACSTQENQYNQQSKRGNSRYKGVTLLPKRSKWQASVGKDYKKVWIGRFATEEEAARAYDEAARRLFGGFARLNFPD